MNSPLPQPNVGSDWTVETLRQHLLSLDAAGEQRCTDRSRAAEQARVLVVDALNTAELHTEQRINLLNDRLSRELTSADLRYQQRYDAQNKALDAALLAAEKAVNTALAAAKEAVTKAEMAAERRFEAVNEFRAQLADQAGTFMPRAEAEARISTNAEKVAETNTRLGELAARVDRNDGRTSGHGDSTRNLVTIMGLLIAVVSVAVTILIATR